MRAGDCGDTDGEMGMKEYIIKVNVSDLTPSEKMCLKDYHPTDLVRCKNCKHGEQCNQNLGEFYSCGKDIGTFETTVHKADWFCADGELKE